MEIWFHFPEFPLYFVSDYKLMTCVGYMAVKLCENQPRDAPISLGPPISYHRFGLLIKTESGSNRILIIYFNHFYILEGESSVFRAPERPRPNGKTHFLPGSLYAYILNRAIEANF